MKKTMKKAYLKHKTKRPEIDTTEESLKEYYMLKNAYGICALAEERLENAMKKEHFYF